MDESIRSITPSDENSWQSQAQSVSDRIEREGYYLNLWEKVKPSTPFVMLSKQDALRPFQLFWESLPNSIAIHTGPFDAVCALAEEYCFGDPPDKAAADRTVVAVLGSFPPKPGSQE